MPGDLKIVQPENLSRRSLFGLAAAAVVAPALPAVDLLGNATRILGQNFPDEMLGHYSPLVEPDLQTIARQFMGDLDMENLGEWLIRRDDLVGDISFADPSSDGHPTQLPLKSSGP